MKNLIVLIPCFLLLFSCNQSAEENSSSIQSPTATSPAAPAKQESTDNSPVLSQEAPVSRIETGKDGIVTYLVNGKDLQNEKVEENGLNSYEAHLASMFALGYSMCTQNQATDNKASFLLINNENKLEGLIELPCNYIRRIYGMIGSGKTKDYSTTKNGDTHIFTSNQLNITANKLQTFKEVVRGIQPLPYNGIEIGQPMK